MNYQQPREIVDLIAAIEKNVGEKAEGVPQNRGTLLSQISELRSLVETPLDSVLRIYSQPMQNTALRIATELGLLEELSTKHQPYEVPTYDNVQLATSSNADPDFVVRIMRVLAAMGACTETSPGSFQPTKLTEKLAEPSPSAGVRFLFDATIAPLSNIIYDNFRDENPKKFNPGVLSSNSPFEDFYETPLFEYLKGKEPRQIELSNSFNTFMAGRRAGQESWLETYPFKERLLDSTSYDPPKPFVVDVGGHLGHDLKAIAEKFDHFPGILMLQDTEETIAMLQPEARPVYDEGTQHYGSIIHEGGAFTAMAHDFFTPQPEFMRGAKVYHLRAILHDWPTSECEVILSHIADAMTAEWSKLIIREFVLPESNAPLFASCNDLLMMVLHAGMERTEAQWRSLLRKVGLEVELIWPGNAGLEAVIEAVKPAKTPELLTQPSSPSPGKPRQPSPWSGKRSKSTSSSDSPSGKRRKN